MNRPVGAVVISMDELTGGAVGISMDELTGGPQTLGGHAAYPSVVTG